MRFGPDYFARVPHYGVGLGINPSDFNVAYLAAGSLVDFFEVTAPSPRHRGSAPYADVRERAQRDDQNGFVRRDIADLAASAKVLVHSTNVNPVYSDLPSESDLAELRGLVHASGSPWVTEDLGVWLMSERHVYPHFMPLPLTTDTLSVAAHNIRRVQEMLDRPFNAEFPPMSYVVGDMNAFEFFARLCDATGCGMCVDVGHVLSYQMARGASPTADLHRLPWPSITEIHFAGGSIDLVREGYFYQDDHGDREVVSICFDLMDEVVATAPNLRAIALELFGAKQPGHALRRLRSSRERPAIRDWLAGTTAPAELVPPESSRPKVRALSVAMYDLLHSDEEISGERLHRAGPELTGVFSTSERRRWDYDRRSRLLVVGNGIARYCPATSGWLRRVRNWSLEEFYGRLIDAVHGVAPGTGTPRSTVDPSGTPPTLDDVADAFHRLLPEPPDESLAHALLSCEMWMNACVAVAPAGAERGFDVDVERAMRQLADPAARLADVAGAVTMVYLGDGRFARRGGAVPTGLAVTVPGLRDEPVVCGTARCCTGD